MATNNKGLDVITLELAKASGGGGGGGGTTNYNQLSNKPQINGHTLSGNKTTSELGFGTLASKNSASGSFTPSGSVSVSKASDTTQTVNSIITVGELPSFTVDSDTLVFNAGTLPTKGSNQTVLSAVGNITASFLPVAGTVTVS